MREERTMRVITPLARLRCGRSRRARSSPALVRRVGVLMNPKQRRSRMWPRSSKPCEGGFVEGHDVAIEYRWAQGQYE
jgi:hypothetical protein